MPDGLSKSAHNRRATGQRPEHVPHDITLRPFRNNDPPALVHIWNSSALGRAAVKPIHAVEFEALVLAKLYFDPNGLIVACHQGTPIGFVHAGFGADESEQRLTKHWGVISAVVVLPQWRRRGIGRALLARAEQYLSDCGAEVIYAGGMRPLNPFYLGLYGGAELPGFLESDAAAGPFFTACDYLEADRCLVFQRPLGQRLSVSDWRFAGLRRKLQVQVDGGGGRPTWWWASLTALFEPWRLCLVSRAGQTVAEASCWEMAGLSRTWGRRTVGLAGVEVTESVRGQGLGKLLVTELLVRLRDEGVELIEVQTMARNQAAMGLYRSTGFEQVDQGSIYRRK